MLYNGPKKSPKSACSVGFVQWDDISKTYLYKYCLLKDKEEEDLVQRCVSSCTAMSGTLRRNTHAIPSYYDLTFLVNRTVFFIVNVAAKLMSIKLLFRKIKYCLENKEDKK